MCFTRNCRCSGIKWHANVALSHIRTQYIETKQATPRGQGWHGGVVLPWLGWRGEGGGGGGGGGPGLLFLLLQPELLLVAPPGLTQLHTSHH